MGWNALGLWVEGIRAYRCSVREESIPEWQTAFTEDNALMLWAMSKTMYSWSHRQGYGWKIRDYLLSQRNALSEFYRGKQSGTNDNHFVQLTEGCYVPFMPLWGIAVYSIAYPDQAGLQSAAVYKNLIDSTLAHQAEVVAAGTNDSRNYTASMGFHMATAARWGKYRNNDTFVGYAKNAWDFIKLRQQTDGTFYETPEGIMYPLRHIQTLWAMIETINVIGDYNGLGQSIVNASNALHVSQNYPAGFYLRNDYRPDLYNDNDCTQLQIAAGFAYLSQTVKDSPQAVHAKNWTSQNKYVIKSSPSGYTYDTWITSNETGLNHTGTQEGNSLAWLVDWWAAQ